MSEACSNPHPPAKGPVHFCSTCLKYFCWSCYWSHKQHCLPDKMGSTFAGRSR